MNIYTAVQWSLKTAALVNLCAASISIAGGLAPVSAQELRYHISFSYDQFSSWYDVENAVATNFLTMLADAHGLNEVATIKSRRLSGIRSDPPPPSVVIRVTSKDGKVLKWIQFYGPAVFTSSKGGQRFSVPESSRKSINDILCDLDNKYKGKRNIKPPFLDYSSKSVIVTNLEARK